MEEKNLTSEMTGESMPKDKTRQDKTRQDKTRGGFPKKIKCELYNDSMQGWKCYPIQKAQLIIAEDLYRRNTRRDNAKNTRGGKR